MELAADTGKIAQRGGGDSQTDRGTDGLEMAWMDRLLTIKGGDRQTDTEEIRGDRQTGRVDR